MIQLTLSFGRTLEQERGLYRHITENLWSFGLGEASYAPAEKATA